MVTGTSETHFMTNSLNFLAGDSNCFTACEHVDDKGNKHSEQTDHELFFFLIPAIFPLYLQHKLSYKRRIIYIVFLLKVPRGYEGGEQERRLRRRDGRQGELKHLSDGDTKERCSKCVSVTNHLPTARWVNIKLMTLTESNDGLSNSPRMEHSHVCRHHTRLSSYCNVPAASRTVNSLGQMVRQGRHIEVNSMVIMSLEVNNTKKQSVEVKWNEDKHKPTYNKKEIKRLEKYLWGKIIMMMIWHQ